MTKGIPKTQFDKPLYMTRAAKPVTEKVSECCSAGFADETFGVVCGNCGEPTGVVELHTDEHFDRNVPTDANGIIVI